MVAKFDLTVGQEANLTQDDLTLRSVHVGLGWDVKQTNDEYGMSDKEVVPYDLDACAFLLNSRRMIRTERDFVFYNNLECEEGCVIHSGDNTTGHGDGDDEVISIELDKVPFDITHIVFTVSIHNAIDRQQTFGEVENAFIRVVNNDTKEEILRYNLTGDYHAHRGIVIGELYRVGSEWVFIAKDEGFSGGLAEIARSYDVNIRGE